MAASDTAILLVNLGTPDQPDAESIRRYLKQFLSDPRVVDFPRWLWLPILNGIILKTRPPKLTEKYGMIWGRHDAPIRNITLALARRLQQKLPQTRVIAAMTYGSPSMADALAQAGDAKRILVLPLFPQYAGATTGAVSDELARAMQTLGTDGTVDFINDYHQDAGYIAALGDSIAANPAYRNGTPKVIFSFHGIPQSQARRGDPYPEHCRTTAELVAARLGLPRDRWILSFQSRFGPFEWLKPYTDHTLACLPASGVLDVLVICPGFSVDCLETLEEIRIQNRDIFLAAGGQSFSYVKALNASQRHADLLAALLVQHIES